MNVPPHVVRVKECRCAQGVLAIHLGGILAPPSVPELAVPKGLATCMHMVPQLQGLGGHHVFV